MKLKEIQERTKKLALLNKNILIKFEPRTEALNYNIKYWLKIGELISLKKGVYIFRSKYLSEKNKDAFLEYIANQLVSPSYISLEYVMAKYQLLTEAVGPITSITTKTTRSYNNKLGSFVYSTISRRLFCGYSIEENNNFPVAVASKSKAVFDFLYLRFRKDFAVNKKEIEELRINWENLLKKEFKEIVAYSLLSKSKKVKKAISLIGDMYF